MEPGKRIMLFIVHGRYHIHQELLDDFQVVHDSGRPLRAANKAVLDSGAAQPEAS